MELSSLAFLLALPPASLACASLAPHHRSTLLLVLSQLALLAFLNPTVFVWFWAVTLLTFWLGQRIDASSEGPARTRTLFIGVAVNLLALIGARCGHLWHEGLMTIGVSYYVFQAISYLIDVYLETTPVERNLKVFALHLCFFPKFLQGPIERAGRLLPQLRVLDCVTPAQAWSGAQLILWGLFKKTVIAGRLAAYVDQVYGNVHNYSGLPLCIATYFYAIQLYCDFSGYTDIAIGASRLFGLELSPNFRDPYLAPSIPEFWRRWHITFSSWLLDYLFKPLQMQFRAWLHWGNALALLLVFTVCGAWHGFAATFLVWGLIHGLYMAVSQFSTPVCRRLYRWLGGENRWPVWIGRVLVTFHLVCFSWIFFRAASIEDAFYVATHLFSGWQLNGAALASAILPFTNDNTAAAHGLVAGVFLVVTGTIHLLSSLPAWRKRWDQASRMLHIGVGAMMLTIILLFGRFWSGSFIYMQF